ncbi:MAG: ATPase associated with various cellular 5 [Blastococcus sp.]|nr:ATPase associated with various cellular 5 [Blastococcus sp.]
MPGYRLSPDLVVQDGSGFLPVLYRQPWPFARAILGVLRAERFIDQDVVVRGRYRRNPAPILELRRLDAADGSRIRGFLWVGAYLLGAGWDWSAEPSGWSPRSLRDAVRANGARGADGGWDARPVTLRELPADPDALAAALEGTGYLPDEGLATAAYLALAMHRPLFLEGEAGVGKTALAHALADVTGRPIYRLQCYEGLEASQALYDWDFGRQLLHLRAAEAAHANDDPASLEASLYDRRFLLARPLLQALEDSPSVLLVDEVDRADDEFEAFLLEVLSDFTISIPELGTVRAVTPPLVILTSNRTREVHDALKRRCLYHWLQHPDFDREVAILRRRLPEVTEQLAREVARAAAKLRTLDLLKPPGIAESMDWATALHTLGARDLDPDLAARTLGAVLKYREDIDRVQALPRGALLGG